MGMMTTHTLFLKSCFLLSPHTCSQFLPNVVHVHLLSRCITSWFSFPQCQFVVWRSVKIMFLFIFRFLFIYCFPKFFHLSIVFWVFVQIWDLDSSTSFILMCRHSTLYHCWTTTIALYENIKQKMNIRWHDLTFFILQNE